VTALTSVLVVIVFMIWAADLYRGSYGVLEAARQIEDGSVLPID
jgi:hypothetical protein